MEPIAVTIEQSTKLLNMSRPSVVALMQNPKFPFFKIGNKTLIPVEGLKKFINALSAQHYRVI